MVKRTMEINTFKYIWNSDHVSEIFVPVYAVNSTVCSQIQKIRFRLHSCSFKVTHNNKSQTLFDFYVVRFETFPSEKALAATLSAFKYPLMCSVTVNKAIAPLLSAIKKWSITSPRQQWIFLIECFVLWVVGNKWQQK